MNFYEYPYTDSSRSNADWLLNSVNRLVKMVDDGDLDKLFNAESVLDDIKSMQYQIAQQNTKISHAAIENLKNKKCFAIGDSYCRGTGNTLGSGIFHWMSVANAFENFYSYATGGAGYIRLGNVGSGDFGGLNYGQALDEIASSLDEDVRNDIDIVLISGGLNDALQGSYAEIMNAVSNTILKVKGYFPNANIYCLAPWGPDQFTNASRLNALYAVERAALNSGAIINPALKWLLMGIDSLGVGDGIHPNIDGYKALSGIYLATLAGASGGWEQQLGANDSVFDGITASYRSGTEGAFAWIKGSFTATFTGNGSQFTGQGTSGDPVQLVTLGGNKCPESTIYLPCYFYKDGYNVIMGACYLYNNGEIGVAPYYTRNLNGSWNIYLNAQWVRGV